MNAHNSDCVILVVDDEWAVRTLVRDILTFDGYSVLLAKDGAEALGMSQRYNGEIRLLITDVTMPRMDGLELIRKLRLDRPLIGILVMSGASDRDVTSVASEQTFLHKPFDVGLLRQKIQDVLTGMQTTC